MIDHFARVREHYSGSGLVNRIKSALTTIVPDGQLLTVDELAPLDQFHIRGMFATAELASAAGVEPSTHVLDIGCSIGGPARTVAATFRCNVIGVDLSPGFIEVAIYLTARSGLSDRVTFQVGNAVHLPFEDAAFNVVFLQHVAMNIADRAASTPKCIGSSRRAAASRPTIWSVVTTMSCIRFLGPAMLRPASCSVSGIPA
jgi:SAM-dependent methyltransferase